MLDDDSRLTLRGQEEGALLGDAVRLIDPEHPQKGLIFDGRIAEDFKLASGTWVSVGPLRAKFIAACAPLSACSAMPSTGR